MPKRAASHLATAKTAAATTMTAIDSTAYDLALSMDIPAASIVDASLGASNPLGVHVFASPLGGFPLKGSSFAAISTGAAIDASLPNDFNLSTELGALVNTEGHDLVQLTVILTVPTGAKYWAIDWKLLSEEYLHFAGSEINDAFFIETPSSNIVITGNVAFSSNNVALDPFGSRVSINTGMTAANANSTAYDGATAVETTSSKIPEGATQITLVFSVTDLADSELDTAVFLDNFRFLTEFVKPPDLDPPKLRKIVIDGTLSAANPTVILTHGLANQGNYLSAPDYLWTGSDWNQAQAAGLIRKELGSNVNIIHLIWEDAFRIGEIGVPADYSHNAAQAYAQDAGEYFASELLKPQYLGSSYSGKIQFIGHSLGTVINAYAARAFLEKATNVKSAQFTSLDRPDHVRTSFLGCSAFPVCKGYGRDFFGDLFHDLQTKPGRDLNLIIDNYFSRESNAVGDTATGLNVYNHGELYNPRDLKPVVFNNAGPGDNHSGIHQFYRWTMDPNGLYSGVCSTQNGNLAALPAGLDNSLDPCNKGWKWSIVRPAPLTIPTQNIPSTSAKSNLMMGLFHAYGCTLVGTTITCIEGASAAGAAQAHLGREETRDLAYQYANSTQSSSPLGISEVNIPASATGISFKYRFTNIGDGDYAAVYLDNVLVWAFTGASYSGAGEFVDSGTVPIGSLTGTRSLSVILYGVGNANAQFEIKDFTVVTPPFLSLNQSRFKIDVTWSTAAGSSGVGTPVQLTSDSGYFWFFGNTNVELVVKLLDGRGTNGHFWFFWGAMTDVQYTITVTDTQTGAVKQYHGIQGVQRSGNDINAFSDTGAASGSKLDLAQETANFDALIQAAGSALAASAPAPPVNPALVLNNNRFTVQVSWSTPISSGVGTPIPLTSDSGYFWFFGNTNVELLVKILDGRGTNGHFWFFWGAMTDVQYTITVTDTQTGLVKQYPGYQGVQQSGNDINAF